MKAIILGLATALVATSAHAKELTPEQAKEVAAICATTACRSGGYEVVVRTDKEHYTTVPVGPSPYIIPAGDILIYPGETIAVQFTVTGDTVSAPKFIRQYAAPKMFAMQIDVNGKQLTNPRDAQLPALPEKNGDVDFDSLPPNTLVISYGQYAGETGMIMVLHSNLAHRIKLDARLSLIQKDAYDWRYTSTCPITHGSFENWPGAQGPMLLSHIRFLPDSDKGTCQ